MSRDDNVLLIILLNLIYLDDRLRVCKRTPAHGSRYQFARRTLILDSSSPVYALGSYSGALFKQDLCQSNKCLQIYALPTAFRPFHFRGVILRGPFCKGMRSPKVLYICHKSKKTSWTLAWLQVAASLKLSLRACQKRGRKPLFERAIY